MSIPSDNCSICLEPLGKTFTENDTDFVTETMHESEKGPAHKVHRYCAFKLFQNQLEKEPKGRSPTDLENVPFSCPLCYKKLTLEDANRASGVSLAAIIKLKRRLIK